MNIHAGKVCIIVLSLISAMLGASSVCASSDHGHVSKKVNVAWKKPGYGDGIVAVTQIATFYLGMYKDLKTAIAYACAEQAADPIAAGYARDMAGLFGPGVRLVSVSPVTGAGLQRTCTLTCRAAEATNAFQVTVTLRATARGAVESLAFDRDVTLPRSGIVRAGEPVPLESLMRAIMLARAARADGTDGLVIQKYSGMTSYKAPDASGIKFKRFVAGSMPTASQSLLDFSTFSVGTFVPTDGRMSLHTFPAPGGYPGSTDARKFSCTFYYVADPNAVTPDTKTDPRVGSFSARLSNGRVYFVYKDWAVNPDNSIVTTQRYVDMQNVFRTNTPGRVEAYGGVAFGIDNSLHAITNIPVDLKTSTTGMKFKNAKARK